MGKIIRAKDIQEKVYLKKDMLGWRVVEPYKDPDTNKINWFILITGGKKNVATLIIILIFLGIGYAGVKETIGNYKTIAENPCDYCNSCQEQTSNVLKDLQSERIGANNLFTNSSSIIGGEKNGENT